MRVHVNHQGGQHFAIMAEKQVCPVCKQGYGHSCKTPQGVLLPRTTVHAERVREMGMNLRVEQYPIHRERITADQNLLLKEFRP